MGGGSSGNILKMVAPLAIGLMTGGTGFALAPWFGSTMTSALLGGGASALLAGGKPQNWLTQGALGGLGAGAMAPAGRGFAAGWNAAGQGGKSLLGQVGSGLQGATFGTYGSGAGEQSLLGPGGSKVGLFPPTGGFSSGGGISGMAQNLGQSAATNMLMSSLASPTPTAGYGSYDLGTPNNQSFLGYGTSQLNGSNQLIRPTPNSAMGSYANTYFGEPTDIGRINDNFDYLVPGRIIQMATP